MMTPVRLWDSCKLLQYDWRVYEIFQSFSTRSSNQCHTQSMLSDLFSYHEIGNTLYSHALNWGLRKLAWSGYIFFRINNLLFSSSMVWYGVHINYLMSGRVSSRVGHWVNRLAVKTLLPTSLGLPIQKKLFLTKKFRSKNFACLWKPVVLQLKTLIKPLMSRVFGDIRNKVLCIYTLVTGCWL